MVIINKCINKFSCISSAIVSVLNVTWGGHGGLQGHLKQIKLINATLWAAANETSDILLFRVQ